MTYSGALGGRAGLELARREFHHLFNSLPFQLVERDQDSFFLFYPHDPDVHLHQPFSQTNEDTTALRGPSEQF